MSGDLIGSRAVTPRRRTGLPRPATAVIGIGAAVIVLILALTAANTVRRYTVELHEAARELRTLDLALAAETARSFQSVELVLDDVADQVAADGIVTADDFAHRMGTREVHDLLRARRAIVPQLDAVTIVGANGKLVNFSRSWPVPDVHLDDRDYYRALRDGQDKLFLSEPVINRGSGTPTIYLARRLSAADGTFLGLALGAIELASFDRFYASMNLGRGNIVALWRKDGVLLARFPAAEPGQRIATAEITSSTPAWHGVDGVFEKTWTLAGGPPETRVVASSPAGSFPIQVNLARSKSLILADWRREAMEVAAAMGFAILGVMGFVWALLRRFRAYEAVAEAWRDREQAIAARERAEAAKEVAEEANRAKSVFLANMSHELRTPLSAVIGYTEMLEEQVEDLDEGSLLTDLGKIKANARHLLGLINDVLDLSKVEASRMETLPESFSVKALASDTVSAVDALVRRKENTLSLDFADDLGTMHTDALKLRQCLINLLSNAAKFTNHGRIVLRVRRTTVAGADWLSFAVEDTGIGLSHAQVGRLFQRFTQADETTTRKFGGTGLGLALSRALARLLGGDIEVESVEGQGSTFTVRIPANLPTQHVDAQRAYGAAGATMADETPADREPHAAVA